MNRRRRSALVLAQLMVTSLAAAQQRPSRHLGDEARRRFRHAVELTDEGTYPAAMTEFLRVYELTRNPALLFNVAATDEAMGDFAEALDALERFEATAPAALLTERRAELEAHRGRLRARTGVLTVAVAHEGLAVTVDGLERPLDALRAGLRVNAGPRRVAMSAPGFHPRERVVQVASEARVTLDEPLVPTRSWVRVRCDVDGAEVRVDDVAVAVTPVSSAIEVTEGRHRVELRRAGYRRYATEVDARGPGASVDAELPWDAPVPTTVGARLVVRASEPGALATLDGRPIPLDGSVTVPPGPHALAVSREHFAPLSRAVALRAGETLRVDARLVPTAAYRDERLASARRARSIGLATTIAGLAVTAAGVTTALVAWSQRNDTVAEMDDIADRYTPRAAGACQGGSCAGVLDAYRRDESLLATQELAIGLGAAFAGAGLATAAVGAWLLATAPSSARFSLGATARSIHLGWSF